jgi:hypothetical protein
MTTEQERSLLVLLDEFVNRMNVPALVPDLRRSLLDMEAADASMKGFAAALIFHALRDLVDAGLVDHTSTGYTINDRGRDEAERVKIEEPQVAQRAREAVREYAVQ